MQEAEAKKNADEIEQKAKGSLSKSKIEDDALAESEKKNLFNL